MAKNRKQMLKERQRDRIRHKNKLKRMIRKYNDPVLYEICTPLSDSDDRSFIPLMRKVCRATDNGVGLAAPQIGVTKQVIFVDPGPKHRNGIIGENGLTMINPVILACGVESVVAVEGCLSYPGVTGPVERAKRVLVEYTPEVGERINKWFEGFIAVIVQHETDHLFGECRIRNFYEISKHKISSDVDTLCQTSLDELLGNGLLWDGIDLSPDIQDGSADASAGP